MKIYPQVIWGEKYQGNFESLVDDLVKAGISNIVVPAFQGSRIFFSQPVDSSANSWSLLPLKKLCKERELGFAIELPLFHDRDSLFPQIDLPPASSYKQEMRAELHAFLQSMESSGIGAVMLYSWDTLHSLPDVVSLIANFNS